MAKKPASKSKRMTAAQKYAALKRQTEQAGMSVREVNGRLVVGRRNVKRKSGAT